MVVFGQSGCTRAKYFYSVKIGCLRESGCTRANVVVFGQNCLYSEKVVVFGQKGLNSCKVVIWAKWL